MCAGVVCWGCQQKQEINGLGPYVLNETKLEYGQQRSRCQPDGDITWCFGAPPIKVGTQPATVDLYFNGHENSALLIEIALRVRSCKADEIDGALTQALGPASESRDKLRFWKGKAAFVSAKLRASGVSCEINFVDPKDQKRIESLEQGK